MLNDHQRAAVQSTADRLVIEAGAGTGKTRVLTARALHLAQSHDLVRLVTFSRRAARVLRARLEESDAPEELVDRVQVDTHHGLAHGLLREYGDKAGLPEGWGIVDREEEKAAKRQAGRQLDLFEAVLGRHHLLRYDDLLPRAIRLLQEHPEVAEAQRGGALLIDEAQDSSHLDHQMAAALDPDSLTVVGDAAQRIYGFRGAVDLPAGPGWSRVSLPVNYRSGQPILDLANLLSIPGRVDLVSATRRRSTAGVLSVSDDEAAVDQLLLSTDLRTHPGRWAILTRTNRRLERVADVLALSGVQFVCPSREAAVWETAPARELLDQLHVCANPHDSYHLSRCLERLGWSQLDLLRAEAGRASTAQSLWDWVCLSGQVSPAHEATGVWLRWVTEIRDLELTAREAAEDLYRHRPLPVSLEAIPAELSPGAFLAWLADPDREDLTGRAAEGCYLGSLHSAKGEEWDCVCLLGLEEGSLPLSRWSDDGRTEEERIAEERRLLYVGITRARERLVLARTETKSTKWGKKPVDSSRFLAELGLE